ncbi:hypothetical protein [Achromobacter xylosoxidans]
MEEAFKARLLVRMATGVALTPAGSDRKVRSAARVRLSVSPTFTNSRRSVRSCLMFHHTEGGHF